MRRRVEESSAKSCPPDIVSDSAYSKNRLRDRQWDRRGIACRARVEWSPIRWPTVRRLQTDITADCCDPVVEGRPAETVARTIEQPTERNSAMTERRLAPRESPQRLSFAPPCVPVPRVPGVFPRRVSQDPPGDPFPTCLTTCPTQPSCRSRERSASTSRFRNWPFTEITDTCATHSLYAMFSWTAHHSLAVDVCGCGRGGEGGWNGEKQTTDWCCALLLPFGGNAGNGISEKVGGRLRRLCILR